MNRRAFLQSFAALAALAVTPALAKLPPSDLERLLAAMESGVIENQTFLLHRPVEIAVSNLIIRGCRFIFDCDMPEDEAFFIVSGKVKNLAIVDNFFDYRLCGNEKEPPIVGLS